MSTLLVGGVVVGAIVGVLRIALTGSDQPATLRPAEGTALGGPIPRTTAGRRDGPVEPAVPDASGPWTRIRAAVLLVVLLVLTGTVLAAALAAVAVAAGLALVRAVT
ncbi:MAG: hypothetical protein LC792_02230 [Actinobacteria bacterium]|nr:hypothetical protein [Actinomycetota bacterium]